MGAADDEPLEPAMPAAQNLSEYLESLPAGRRATFDRLVARVAAVPVPPSISAFTFRADESDHPDYDDAERVFWKAVAQLYLQKAVSDGELPLVYWGFHSIDLLGRRHSNGILVTDRTVYLDDVGRGASHRELQTLDPAGIRINAGSLEVAGTALDLTQIAAKLQEATAEDTAGYLAAVITTLQTAAAESAPAAGVAESQTVEQLVLASRLSADFLLPSRPKDAKGLAKLAAKWKLPAEETVLVSLSSATFAGVYGIAVTNAAVYSRDLMEAVQRTPLAKVTEFAWDAGTKTFRVADDHVAPTHPAITDDNRAYVTTLLAHLTRAAARS
jgi:hypothetical protein